MPMRPNNKGPIITDFEEVSLPEDDDAFQDDDGLIDLRHVFASREPTPESGPAQSDDTSGNTVDEQTDTFDDSGALSSDSSSAPPSSTDTSEQSDLPDTSAAESGAVENDGECPVTAESTFEAMLFVGNADDGLLSTATVCELLHGVTEDEVVQLAESISQRWREDDRPYRIERVAGADGDSWRMVLDEGFEPVRSRFYSSVREFQLNQASINVLAIVAYQQPITADQITQILNLPQPPTAILSQLVKRHLLQVERTVTNGRRLNEYRTTDRFLKLCGLESLEELPQAEDFDM